MLPEALKGGFADSLPLQIFGARMAARTFEPSIGSAYLMLKDLTNALDVASRHGLDMPMASRALELYGRLKDAGKIDKDPSALVDL
jgi:3-hydroxyisobutyrate dehydrogenase